MSDEKPVFEIETLTNPVRYSYAQVERAGLLAAFLGRGKLVLCEPPEEKP